jgi:hypothetical protein
VEDQNTPNPNDARTDRALAALRTAGGGTSDVKLAAARMLADLRHLCRRHRIAIGAVTEQAAETYRDEVERHGPGRYEADEPAVFEPLPIEVVTITLRGNNRYRSSVLEVCGEFLDDADILVSLWDLLVEALVDGKASEDPGDVPHRTFYVEVTQRPAVAAQLLALRSRVTSEGATDPPELTEPDGGLAQFLD